MRTVRVRRRLEGSRIADAEALWYDPARWSAFVDGFGHVDRIEGGWPERGSRVVWDSRPGGRGRVVERVAAYEPRVRQAVEVEDPDLRGTQTVGFEARDAGCEITLQLAYELKAPGFGGPVADVLFVRRALRESMTRTLSRFARELTAERELASS
jgi:hypothetical protein